MTDALRDWESPEFGEAVRAILDAHEASASGVSEAAQQRLLTLIERAGADPPLFTAAWMSILNASLSLDALVPCHVSEIPQVRQTLENAVYDAIQGMPPPSA